ncbi:MAG: hypothetical protein HYU02_07960 [Thaumarchaeota archaeon]|nr:hypothetical protein [Nitrososphaerota archaeon]
MTEPVPAYAQEAYAILYNRFASDSFPSDYLAWFISQNMVKKTLHVLEKAGWIRRVEKGKYVCVKVDDIFRSMVEFKVPRLLQEAERKYAYTEASAVEIWTDYSYIQRSWEHSPYYIKVLRNELHKWVQYFRKHRVNVYIDKPEPSLGEFVILKPQGRLSYEVYNGLPVESLHAVVEYCEKYIDNFEYPLAYLKAKFKVKTKADIDKRVLEEAVRAV